MNELNENDKKIELLQKQLKEAMNDKRTENALIEKAQVGLMMKYIEQERKAFEYADTSIWILKDKNDIDIMLIMDQIVEWNKKAKNSNQQKLLTELFLAILRIQSYVENLETLNQHAVAKYVTQKELSKNTLSSHAAEVLKYKMEISELERKLENAKKEIDFIERNNS